jgi:GntR family histidine utilization transcriptional repressor
MDAVPVSLHQRILSDIREKIVSGDWPPGTRIPFEHELAAEYGCSRMTVNKAMAELHRDALIVRRRRSGSFVAEPRSQAAILEIHDIRTEVQALGRPYHYELVERRQRRMGTDARLTLDVEPRGSVIALKCRHLAGKTPFCWEERLINLAAVPGAAGESFAEIAPGPWLVARVPWSAAEHRISATSADAETAAALEIRAGSPCLVIERRTWSAERPVTAVRLTYAGDGHTVVARFTPS